MDLNNLIGEFAGSCTFKLVFTLTPKRHFLGAIWIKGQNKTRRLKKTSWVKVVIAPPAYIRVVIRQMENYFLTRHGLCYRKDFYELLNMIQKHFMSIIDYRLTM
jgi:hypothetical protein